MQRISRKLIYTGRVLRIVEDQIELSNNTKITRDLVLHPGAVIVIPVLSDQCLIMVKQYRYAVNQTLLEFPAGTLDQNEDPINCARRELQEEIGYRAGNIKKIGELFPSPGFCDEIQHVFIAENLEQSKLPADLDEVIEPIIISKSEFEDCLLDSKTFDGKTLAVFLLAKSQGLI